MPKRFIEIKPVNLKRVLRQLSKTGPKLPGRMAKAMDRGVKPIMAQSQEIVPVDKGELRDSMTDSPAVAAGGAVEKNVGYMANHASFVHEDLEAEHPGGGQAKYLEEPLRDGWDDVIQGINAEIQNELDKVR